MFSTPTRGVSFLGHLMVAKVCGAKLTGSAYWKDAIYRQKKSSVLLRNIDYELPESNL
jgi:hypothetical protein